MFAILALRMPLASFTIALATLLQFPATARGAGIDRIVPKHLPHKCLDLEHGDKTNGNQIVLWDCWNTDRQKWLVSDKFITLKNDTSKCLDFWGHDPTKKAEDGNILQVYDCSHLHGNHEWFFNTQDSTIRWKSPDNHEEKCMDVFEGKDDNGAYVGLWECNGEQHQEWALGDGTGVAFVAY